MEIKTTINHPYFYKEYNPKDCISSRGKIKDFDFHLKWWIQAGRLEKGNVVYSLDGKKETVESAETEEADEEEETVYNFEVEEYHTYFVGKDKILVHNNCEKKQQSYWRGLHKLVK